MNLQVTKRLSHGFTHSFAYTWSRTLGENSTDSIIEYLDPRNRHLNKSLLTFHRTHDFRSNGTVELTFGPGRKLLNDAPGFVSRIVERWQLGALFSWSSGAPVTVVASSAENTWTVVPGTINLTRTANTPLLLGNFPKSTGKLTYTSSGAYYFDGYKQVTDPSVSNVTTLQTLQGSFSNRALADANNNIVLANPAPGTIGTLGRQWIEGPTHANFDVNLVKRIRVAERREFEIRVDCVNVMNNPRWTFVTATPGILDINNPNFGKLTGADPTGANQADNPVSNRRFTFNARFNF